MAAISEYPEKWTMNQLGGTGLAISAYEQGLKFAYTGNGVGRGAYIQGEASIRLWSMPKALRFSVNPGDATVKRLSLTFTNGAGKTYPAVNVTTDEMAKNTVSTFELPLESVIDINDVSNYPLTVNAIRMDLGKSDKGKAYELLIPEFKAVYNTYGSVETLNAESSSMRLYPNPVADGVLNIAAEGVGTLSVYNNAGALVLSQPLDCSAGVAAANVASLQAGIYYARFVTANGASVQKFIVK